MTGRSQSSAMPRRRIYQDLEADYIRPSCPPPQWAHLPVAEQIAEAMTECFEKNGACWIIDIRAMGFSLNDIARYWPDACDIVESRKIRLRNA